LSAARTVRGVATCRTEKRRLERSPLLFAISGGSVGLQIGVQGVDPDYGHHERTGNAEPAFEQVLSLERDASVAAGPGGAAMPKALRTGSWRAEVLTYSRARGLFAGVTLNGAVIGQDKDATRELFGRLVPFRTILTGAVSTPPRRRAIHQQRPQSHSEKKIQARLLPKVQLSPHRPRKKACAENNPAFKTIPPFFFPGWLDLLSISSRHGRGSKNPLSMTGRPIADFRSGRNTKAGCDGCNGMH